MPGHAILVEDDDAVRLVMSRWLKDAEVPHEVCPTAEIARERLRQNGIALALVDVNLPGEGGIELARWIDARYERVRVVLVTGDENAAMSHLEYDSIVKPLDPMRFTQAVRRFLEEANNSRDIERLKRITAKSDRVMKLAAAIVAAIQTALAAWIGMGAK